MLMALGLVCDFISLLQIGTNWLGGMLFATIGLIVAGLLMEIYLQSKTKNVKAVPVAAVPVAEKAVGSQESRYFGAFCVTAKKSQENQIAF